MRKNWIITPFESQKEEEFNTAWEFDLKNGTIAVGWSQLGNILHGEISEDDYKKRFVEIYGKDIPNDRWEFWNFYKEISVGDRIIARKGRKKILAVGEVTSPAYLDKDKGRKRVGNQIGESYPNFRNVRWEEKNMEFSNLIFPMFAIWNIDDEKYNSLLETGVNKEVDNKAEQAFKLEKHLEDFIVSNFMTIFGEQFVLYKDKENKDVTGQQFATTIGTIDILAKEPKTNSYVIIELKKGLESDVVVGQVLRYMGWIKEHLCKENEQVKGLIICKEKDEKLEYALKAIPQSNIDVKLFRISFELI